MDAAKSTIAVAHGAKGEEKPHRVLPLFAMVVLLHLIYPMTAHGTLYTVAYQMLYGFMFLAGIYLSRNSRSALLATVVTATLFVAFGAAYAADATNPWKILATYLALMAFQVTVMSVLMRFIFSSRRVTRDVLYAALTVYLLIAAVFVPVYGIVLHLEPDAVADGAAPGQTVSWQQLVYFSFVTLTTLGYGDMAPVSGWARAVAGMESVAGVLYLAVLIARLVAMYSSER